MDLETLIIIAAFILGGAAVSWWSNRSGAGKHPEQDAPPHADPVRPDFTQPAQESFPSAAEPAEGNPAPAARLAAIPVTLVLIAICVLIALLSSLGENRVALLPFLIATPDQPGLAAVLSGDVWRLLTPAFIHFGIVHLAFNMIWLWDLGGLLERRMGHRFLLGFVVAVGIASNLAQFLLTGNPWFGGMSGVVYGMFGYVWIQGRVNPAFGYTVSNQTVVIMLAWFALCWLGFLGSIANWAHTAGLAMGAVLGARKGRG